MVIRQAMGCPRAIRPRPSATWLISSSAKAGGFVADALARHGIQGASVAPAAVRSESAGA